MKIKNCKLREIISCEKNEDILKIAKKLKEEKARHIIVTDSKKPVGIISTTDINNRVVAEDKDPKKTSAEDIMTKKILIKDIEELLSKTYIEMIKENIFSCPVTEKGKLKGMLDLKEVIDNLSKSKIN